MKTYTQEELTKILTNHALWAQGKPEGVRANLQGANLWRANLRSANLRSANLCGANLQSADLQSANLWGADLRSANLRSANLWRANLRSANLWGADLQSADLQSANLQSANLWRANLTDVKNFEPIKHQIVPESGPFEAYKKVRSENGLDLIVTLYVPRSAQRVGGLTERKCRVEKVKVKRIQRLDTGEDVQKGLATHDRTTEYVVGEWVRPDKYDPDPTQVGTHGIHIFITRKEAEEYVL